MDKLSLFVRKLNEQTLTQVSYARVLHAVFSGAIPAENVRGRWYVSPDALPAAVELFSGGKRRAA